MPLSRCVRRHHSNFIKSSCSHISRLNRVEKHIRYSSPDVTDEWKPTNKLDEIPTKSNGIQDRFHPVTIHHVKHVPGKPSQLIQQPLNQNTQAIILPFKQQSISQQGLSQPEQIIQVDDQPESHAGEIIPELVNPESVQSLDFPIKTPTQHITPPPSTAPTPTTVNPSSESLKTVYVPWIYIPPSPIYKDDSYSVVKDPEPGYPPPEPNYLPPNPSYLPPKPSYLPPEPTYLPPKPTYLPPEPGYLPPPKPTYLPPAYTYPPPPPQPGYAYPSPPLPLDEEKEKAAEFTYFFLGRKLWYIPLYFSIYFVLYVGYLVLKAIARHKLKFPHLLHNASVVSGRDLIELGLFSSRDFNDMEELFKTITKAIKSD
ncbi:hypothetical protein WDU94_004163 [Cyamophila willieti]